MLKEVQMSEIKQLINQMGEKTVLLLTAAVQAVIDGDLKAAKSARLYEKEVDALCRTIDESCVECIAARHPAESDLKLLIATLKISSEVERIADYGNNIAKLVQNNFVYLDLSSLKPMFGAFGQMGEEAIGMLKNAMEAYKDNDEKLALSVLGRDSTVNNLNKALFKGILASVTVKPWTQEVSLDFHIAVRYLERVADRSTNIAEWVLYANSGHYYNNVKQG